MAMRVRCRWRATPSTWPRARGERQTDASPLAEGIYVKVEEGGRVTARYKWIRASFLTSVVDSGGHWLDRPIVQNRLAPGVNLYDPAPAAGQGASGA